MNVDEYSGVRQRVFTVLEDFVDAFSERKAPAHLDDIVNEDKYLKGRELGQKPERFVEENLIWDVLEALGYETLSQPYGYPRWHRDTADFAVTNFDFDFEFSTLGEVKTPNKFRHAEEQVEEYVQKDLENHTIAFATDGLTWRVYFRSRKSGKMDVVSEAFLRDSLEPLVARHRQNEEYDSHSLRQKMTYIEDLTKSSVEEYVTEKAERESWE
jgi:hypothetical protein